jgi:hypothetical protein
VMQGRHSLSILSNTNTLWASGAAVVVVAEAAQLASYKSFSS